MKIDAGRLGKVQSADSEAFLSAIFSPSVGAQSLEVPISRLIPWSDKEHSSQPFRPYTQEKLLELAENIRQYGVLSPIFLRPFGEGYQILAGHNRVAAAKIAGLATIPAVIRELDNDTARVVMTDTNLYQREKLLPSEKAWAYRIRLEALNRQGQRTDLILTQVMSRFRSGDASSDGQSTSRQVVGKSIVESADVLADGQPTSRQVVGKSIVESADGLADGQPTSRQVVGKSIVESTDGLADGQPTSRQVVGKSIVVSASGLADDQPSSRQLVGRLESADEAGTDNGDSGRQVQRYIRLTYLIPSLLARVDDEILPFTVGVALSYLSEEQQQLLLRLMERHRLKRVSRVQAEEMKLRRDQLDEPAILGILGLSAVVQKPQTITMKLPLDFFPSDMPKSLLTDTELQRRIAEAVTQFMRERGVRK